MEKSGFAPVGAAVTVQVYVKVDSPTTSAPRTERLALIPATTDASAAAADAMVGGGSAIVMPATPWTLPLMACTVALPMALGLLYRPDVSTEPIPLARVH